MFGRIYAIFRARNLEFLRDRGTLAWNIVLPIALMFGLAVIFGDEGRSEYTVGIVHDQGALATTAHPFLDTRYIHFVPITDIETGVRKVSRHQLDLLVDLDGRQRYWINADSPKGFFAEIALLRAVELAGDTIEKAPISGEAVRYVDWVLPGILGMNIMFSSLFGVGYVVVRYRKNGFLKRLRATPLTALEFIIAQVASRLILIMAITTVVFLGTKYLLDTPMEGSYATLFLIAIVGTIAMISMGLIVAARVTSEELAGGLVNIITWPMMLMSGVWFSLEGAGEFVRSAASVFPLTHVLDSARAVMLDGATLYEVAPNLIALTLMSAIFLGIGAALFRWRAA